MAMQVWTQQLTGDPIMSELTRRYKRNALVISTLVLFAWVSGVELSTAKFFDISPGPSAMTWGMLTLLLYTTFFFITGYRQDWLKWHERLKSSNSNIRMRFLFIGSAFERFIDMKSVGTGRYTNPEPLPDDANSLAFDDKSNIGKQHIINAFPRPSGRSLYLTFWVWEVRLPQIIILIAIVRLILLITPDPSTGAILSDCNSSHFP